MSTNPAIVFAASAMCNPKLVTGEAPDWQLKEWFGERSNITRQQIAARQAYEYAEAMCKYFSE